MNSFSFSSSYLDIISINGQQQLAFNQQRMWLKQIITNEFEIIDKFIVSLKFKDQNIVSRESLISILSMINLPLNHSKPPSKLVITTTYFSCSQNIIILLIISFHSLRSSTLKQQRIKIKYHYKEYLARPEEN
jgi:hypothetical protein